MIMLKIDCGRMYSAISNVSEAAGGHREDAYLNRQTGEIVFIPENDGIAAAWYGDENAVDSAVDRGSVKASPDQWLKIPKYDGQLVDYDEDRFIQEFFEEHGIDAKLA
jgi:hypothetical protein